MLRKALLALGLLLVTLPPEAMADVGQAAVTTRYGALQGERSAGAISKFLGIPFAHAPVGDLRWRAPEPPSPWQGVRAASSYAPACPQTNLVPLGGAPRLAAAPEPESEDCLYLNIWTPAKARGEHLPVMVWIFGGGFQRGSGSSPRYDGTAFARKGVVLVTLNYRVGVFGFLVHPELKAESKSGTSGNYGILDQIQALRWVRENIASFGGDPTKVTVFGQSAGSTSVNILQASPLAKGLFQRAIGESTSQMDAAAGVLGAQTVDQAEQYGLKYMQTVGAKTLAELRALPTAALQKPGAPFWPLMNDGYVLPAGIYQTFAAGRQNDVPLLVGWNESEGSNIRVPWLKPQTEEEKARFAQLYSSASDIQNFTDVIAWQMRSWAGLDATTGTHDAYVYRFDQVPAAPAGGPQGAFHGAEVPYVFQTLASTGWAVSQNDTRLSALMADYWVNFAKTGNPNGPGLPTWPAYSPARPAIMDLSAQPSAVTAPREAAFQFVDGYFARRR